MLMGSKQLERLFRKAASLDIDKSDLKRLSDFIAQRLRDLLLLGQAAASRNGRDIIDYPDVPITKGLAANIQDFKAMDEQLNLSTILEQLAGLPPLKLGYSEELTRRIPELVGGITVSLARVLRALNEQMKNPGAEEWEKAERIYEILL